MKKAFAFSFLVILLLNTAGYFISFSIERYKIHEQTERLLKQEAQKHSQQFAFTPRQFKRLRRYENGKEFSMGGYMYDVISAEFKNGKFILTAYCDHKETNLLEKFSALFGKQTAQTNSKLPLPLFGLIGFMPTITSWQYHAPLRQLGTFAFNSSRLLSVSLNISSPPPDCNFL